MTPKLLIILFFLFIIFALFGCGTRASLSNYSETDYILVSHAKAGGVYKIIRGEVTTCKLTEHGNRSPGYIVEFVDGSCVVTAKASESEEIE